MLLADWLASNGKTLTWLAEQVERDASVMSRLKAGLTRPSNEVSARIQALTGGLVTAADHERAYARRLQKKCAA